MKYIKQKNYIEIKWETIINKPIEVVWKFIADSNLTNYKLGHSDVKYKEVPNPRGGSIRYATTTDNGFKVEYIDTPYEWIKNNFIQLIRPFSKGLIELLVLRVDFVDLSGKTKLNYFVSIKPRNILLKSLIYLVFKYKEIKNVKKYFQYIENKDTPQNNQVIKIDEIRITYLSHHFLKFSSKSKMNIKIANYIETEEDQFLLKMRPYRIANQIGENNKEVLKFFLNGTKFGIFEMNWDIICPSCRGAKNSVHTLKELNNTVHCDTCNITFDGEFEKSIELTFQPHQTIKELNTGIYCFGNPSKNDHIIAQFCLEVNESVQEFIELKNGNYKISSPHIKNYTSILVDENGDDIKEIIFPLNINQKIHTKNNSIKFKLINTDPSGEVLIKLEKQAWLENIVTAFEATAMQEFRDIFSSEVLKIGQEISIKNITILFTDLKGSTQFYNNRGDAFAYKAVNEHFEILTKNAEHFNGAIVKTIGDAIMGVFVDPLNAVKYSIQVLKDIHNLNLKYKENLINIKIGIHSGSALAVNMNDKLDYFGQTVNLAARTESQCRGNDIIITKNIYDNDSVKNFIKENSIQIESFKTNLKGFDDSFEMVRLVGIV